jgi:hypothetical protein
MRGRGWRLSDVLKYKDITVCRSQENIQDIPLDPAMRFALSSSSLQSP